MWTCQTRTQRCERGHRLAAPGICRAASAAAEWGWRGSPGLAQRSAELEVRKPQWKCRDHGMVAPLCTCFLIVFDCFQICSIYWNGGEMKVLVHAGDAVSYAPYHTYHILGSFDLPETFPFWPLADRPDGRFTRQENEKLKSDVSTKSEAWSEASSVEHVWWKDREGGGRNSNCIDWMHFWNCQLRFDFHSWVFASFLQNHPCSNHDVGIPSLISPDIPKSKVRAEIDEQVARLRCQRSWKNWRNWWRWTLVSYS